MKIVVAPDSFKESLTAAAAAAAMARGVRAACPEAEVVCLPVADGGEGTVDALVQAEGGEYVVTVVRGPLGQPVRARWGLLPGKKAVIEMSAASGLALIPPGQRNPLITCTFGTGQLLAAALDRGCRQILLGIGGSATVDGGAGALRALGARLLDSQGNDIGPGGAGLASLATIDLAGIDPRLADTRLSVACDVNNPLLGPQGAAAVYGPQKGADENQVCQLEAALARFARVASKQLNEDISSWPGSGAAGGLAAGLALTGAVEIKAGIQLVLDTVKFDQHLHNASLLLTGEGRIDSQSAMGKAISGVANRARAARVPVIALGGSLGRGYRDLYAIGVASVVPITDGPISLAAAINRGGELLEAAARRVMELVLVEVAKGQCKG